LEIDISADYTPGEKVENKTEAELCVLRVQVQRKLPPAVDG
jgi:hypothetical protein